MPLIADSCHYNNGAATTMSRRFSAEFDFPLAITSAMEMDLDRRNLSALECQNVVLNIRRPSVA